MHVASEATIFSVNKNVTFSDEQQIDDDFLRLFSQKMLAVDIALSVTDIAPI